MSARWRELQRPDRTREFKQRSCSLVASGGRVERERAGSSWVCRCCPLAVRVASRRPRTVDRVPVTRNFPASRRTTGPSAMSTPSSASHPCARGSSTSTHSCSRRLRTANSRSRWVARSKGDPTIRIHSCNRSSAWRRRNSVCNTKSPTADELAELTPREGEHGPRLPHDPGRARALAGAVPWPVNRLSSTIRSPGPWLTSSRTSSPSPTRTDTPPSSTTSTS